MRVTLRGSLRIIPHLRVSDTADKKEKIAPQQQLVYLLSKVFHQRVGA
jgi:hypothetical protein